MDSRHVILLSRAKRISEVAVQDFQLRPGHGDMVESDSKECAFARSNVKLQQHPEKYQRVFRKEAEGR